MTETTAALEVVRIIGAPPDRVWRAWTDPVELVRWWWPERFGTTYEVDLRPGGSYCFRTVPLAHIGILCVAGRYLEVRPPELLTYTWRWEGSEEPESHVRVEFAEAGNGTQVRILHAGLPDDTSRENHSQGWSDCIHRLQALFTYRPS